MSQQFLFLVALDWKAGIWIFQGVRKLNGAKWCTFLPKENVVVMHLNFIGGECPSGVIVLGGYCPRGILSSGVNVRGLLFWGWMSGGGGNVRGLNAQVVIVPIPFPSQRLSLVQTVPSIKLLWAVFRIISIWWYVDPIKPCRTPDG